MKTHSSLLLLLVLGLFFAFSSCDSPATSETSETPLTMQTAMDLVWNLPQVEHARSADPNFGTMEGGEPSEEEPYFIVKTGSNMDSHFATSATYYVHAHTREVFLYNVFDDELEPVN